MKNLILAAFAALSLTAAIAPLANAATTSAAHQSAASNPYSYQFVGGGD